MNPLVSDTLKFVELRASLEEARAAATNPALIDLIDRALWLESLWADRRLGAAVGAVRN